MNYNSDDCHKKNGVDYYVGDDNTINVEKGMFFENVNKFKEAVRDVSVKD